MLAIRKAAMNKWKIEENSKYNRAVGEIDYIVIDDMLNDTECRDMHRILLNNPMWRKKNPISKHLYNSRPKCVMGSLLLERVEALIRQKTNEELILIDHWALLYSKNTDGNMHADFGQFTLTYWLTPEEHNLNKNTGGLLLYDVQRPKNSSANQYLTAGGASEKYVSERTQNHVVVPYRHNRAVLFDSSHFHKTHTPNFDITKPEGMRMNLTFSYASTVHVIEQVELINGEHKSNV